MFVMLRVRAAASARRVGALGVPAALLLATVAQGCSVAPTASFGGPEPSDPSVRVAGAAYRSTFRSYLSQRPVEPRPWREQNERVAPTPKR
jgi:hypothetical protein